MPHFNREEDPRATRVLEFWLGDARADDTLALEFQSQWFQKSDAFDAALAQEFSALHKQAQMGMLDNWASTPWGRLALIIVLDQFSRNLYRGRPEAFACDAQALALALDGIALGHDQEVPLVARIFYYLPLEHAEDLTLQKRSVTAFERLHGQAKHGHESFFANTLDYAQKHLDVIAQFGRFPHRNAILGRESSAAEQVYLSQPGAGF